MDKAITNAASSTQHRAREGRIGLMGGVIAAQETVGRADAARRKAKVERQAAFCKEHEVKGKSYREIATEVGLDRSRVIQIIKGRDR